jgi:hypothetical protein
METAKRLIIIVIRITYLLAYLPTEYMSTEVLVFDLVIT